MTNSLTFKPEELAACKKFCESQNNNYGTRNQFNPAAIARQIYVGKLGEFAAYYYLQPDFSEVSSPDLEIYTARKKSWKPDLTCDGFDFHVKAQSVEDAERYGLSWTFQFASASGKGGRDLEIFKEDGPQTSFIIFVSVDLKANTAQVHAVLSAQKLVKKNLFREPRLKHLQGIKKVVYHEDIIAAGLDGANDHFPL